MSDEVKYGWVPDLVDVTRSYFVHGVALLNSVMITLLFGHSIGGDVDLVALTEPTNGWFGYNLIDIYSMVVGISVGLWMAIPIVALTVYVYNNRGDEQ